MSGDSQKHHQLHWSYMSHLHNSSKFFICLYIMFIIFPDFQDFSPRPRWHNHRRKVEAGLWSRKGPTNPPSAGRRKPVTWFTTRSFSGIDRHMWYCNILWLIVIYYTILLYYTHTQTFSEYLRVILCLVCLLSHYRCRCNRKSVQICCVCCFWTRRCTAARVQQDLPRSFPELVPVSSVYH